MGPNNFAIGHFQKGDQKIVKPMFVTFGNFDKNNE